MAHSKVVANPETGEMKELNDNFVQFYVDNMDLIININRENSTAGTILLWIVKHMDHNNALVASQQAICEALDIHRNTVTNAVNYLKKVQALDVLKSGTTNVYTINTEIAWKSSAEKKQYAHFTAKVFLARSEQSQYKTQYVGHAVKKKSSGRRKKHVEDAIDLGGSAALAAIGLLSFAQLF